MVTVGRVLSWEKLVATVWRFSVFEETQNQFPVQSPCQPKLLPGLVHADLKTVLQRVIFTIRADRDPARPEACFKSDGDMRV